MKRKPKLGDEVTETITGFTGVAVAKIEFLNGCTQFAVQPKGLTKDGEMQDKQFIDIQQLEVVRKDTKKDEKKDGPGGGFRDYPSSQI